MQFVKSIWTLSLALALSVALSSCATGPVTNARICVEIPFVDGPEGACVWTVTHKTELVNAQDWAKQRPTMLMIDAKSWTDIKKDWLRGCRMAGLSGQTCNVKLQTIDTAIQNLDSIAGSLIKP